MKKLLFVFTACAFLAACSDGSTTNTDVTTDTSTTVTTDTSTIAPATVDTISTMSADSSAQH